MLKLRVLTALVLLPLAIWGVLALPSYFFELIATAVVLLGAWEWSRISQVGHMLARCSYVVFTLCVLWLMHYFQISGYIVFTLAMLAWFFASCWVITFGLHGRAKWLQSMGIKLFLGVIMLCSFWLAIVFIRESLGPAWLLAAMAIVWSADSSAYFAGRFFGKHHLAPKVSPKKTWEGVGGAMLMAFVLLIIYAWYFQVPSNQWLGLSGLIIFSTVVSVFGDLFVSLLKRLAGVKDTGSFLPGHGGLLDRIDGLLAAMPLFAFVSLLLGH